MSEEIKFTNQELDKIHEMYSQYLKHLESKITEGVEQQKLIESLIEALRLSGTEDDLDAIAAYEDASENFSVTVNTFLDDRPIITSILEKCKEMKSK